MRLPSIAYRINLGRLLSGENRNNPRWPGTIDQCVLFQFMVVFTAIDHYAPIVEHILSLASGTGRHAFMIHLDDILATSQRIAVSHTVWTLCIISNKSAVWRRIKSLIAHNDAIAESELIVALALCRRFALCG